MERLGWLTVIAMLKLRGVNLGGWFSQIDCIEEKDPVTFPGMLAHIQSFLGKQDFERIKSWGFNHVRLPVDYFNIFSKEGLKPDEEVFALLDQAIDEVLDTGLNLIFDLHKCPGHDFHEGTKFAQAFFESESVRADAKRVWSQLAERYGSKKGVMLEILNEPVAPDNATWNRVKDEMAALIRQQAPQSTIVVGSNLWNNANTFSELNPVDDDNILYSFHYYQPLLFTHQLAPWVDVPDMQVARPYPGKYEVSDEAASKLPMETGEWDRDRMKRSLEQVCEFRSRYDLPVACNEFGVYVGGAQREYHLAWMKDFLSILKEHDIGYSYWNYKNLDFGIVSQGESLFENYPQYANEDRVDRELIELLQKY